MMMGITADVVAANRKILEEIQYRVRKAQAEPKDEKEPMERI